MPKSVETSARLWPSIRISRDCVEERHRRRGGVDLPGRNFPRLDSEEFVQLRRGERPEGGHGTDGGHPSGGTDRVRAPPGDGGAPPPPPPQGGLRCLPRPGGPPQPPPA